MELSELWIPSKLTAALSDSADPQRPLMPKTERIAKCLVFAAKSGGEFWKVLEKAAQQIIADFKLPPKAQSFLWTGVKDKDAEIVKFMAPFMLFGQEELTPVHELVQKGLIYNLLLKIEGCSDWKDALNPLIRSMSPTVPEKESHPVLSEPTAEPLPKSELLDQSVDETTHSIDYAAHLAEREKVRKLLDSTTKRKEEAVSLLAAAVTPVATVKPRIDSEPKTPHPASLAFFDETADSETFPEEQIEEEENLSNPNLFDRTAHSETSSPKPLQLTNSESPNASLFEKTGHSEVAEIESGEVDLHVSSSASEENIFNWAGVTLSTKATFKDSHPLRCCRFAPSGDEYVVGSNTKVLRRFRRPDPSDSTPPLVDQIANLHDASIYCLDYAPSGELVATGSNDKIVKIVAVDAESEMRVISEMSNHDGTVRAVRFLPTHSPTLLASGGAGDGRVFLTDVTTEQVLKYTATSSTARPVVTDLAPVSADLLYIASNSTVCQWDCRQKTPTHLDISLPVQSLSANPSVQNFLAAGCENGTVSFWDTRNTSLPLYSQKAHSKAIRSIAMKGNWLLAGSMDETISLHNLQKNQNVVAAECGSNCRGVVSVDLHSGIEAAITNQADGTSLFWDISFV